MTSLGSWAVLCLYERFRSSYDLDWDSDIGPDKTLQLLAEDIVLVHLEWTGRVLP
jgi:hypothetical protein